MRAVRDEMRGLDACEADKLLCHLCLVLAAHVPELRRRKQFAMVMEILRAYQARKHTKAPPVDQAGGAFKLKDCK